MQSANNTLSKAYHYIFNFLNNPNIALVGCTMNSHVALIWVDWVSSVAWILTPV